MDYRHKPINKFPYVFYLNVPPNTCYRRVSPWIRDNIGKYNDLWYCPRGWKNGFLGFAYAFKHEEDAVAFKLRWE